MSIQEFHAQLTAGNDQDALMDSLRALSQLADLATVAIPEDAGWAIWDSGE
jgi:hypothetical protein